MTSIPGKTSPHVLAIDVGGSSIRSAVFDDRGRVIGLRSRPHRFVPDENGAQFAEEFHAEGTWKSTREVIRAAIRDADVAATSIIAVAATGQRHGLALTTAEGHTLYLGPTSEARAFFQGQALEDEAGDEIYATTGHLPALIGAPAKLRWLAETHPDFESAAHVLTLDGWVAHQLTGAATMTVASGVEIGLVELQARDWAHDLLERIAFPKGLLPGLVTSGSVVGEVSNQGARQTGLCLGTPVIAAGPDTQCGLLGMGVREAGHIGILAGSTAPLQMVVEHPVLDGDQRTWTGAHVLEERWVVDSGATDAGGALSWLAELIMGDTNDALRLVDREAAKAQVGSAGALALLGPRQADAADLGPRWGGLLFATPLVASRIDQGNASRAALENVAYAIKTNVEQIKRVAGMSPSAIAVGGGLVASRVFCRILTDVLGTMVRVVPSEASALGAAICAATGAGLYASLPTAARRMASGGRVLKPDAVASLEYEGHYDRWCGMNEHMDGARDLL